MSGGKVVAWLHEVVQGDGEPDQALSFAEDSFPLEGVTGYRKVSCQPLVLQSDLAAAIARAEAAEAERDRLRAFALDVMEDWHEGDLDGGTRQALAEQHGLIAPIERFAPCGEECGCSEYFTEDDWKSGQTCYRMTSLLTGKPESDAAIAAQQAEGADGG